MPSDGRPYSGLAKTADWDRVVPVVRAGASQVVAAELHRAITAGAFPPNWQLSEQDLAERFHVSRGPIREALQRLIAQGLVRGEPNRGAFVLGLDLEALRDLYLAREAIEAKAAVSLARNPLGEATGQLDDCVSQISASAAGPWDAMVDADMRFHETLVRVTGSRHLQHLFGVLAGETRLYLHWLEPHYQDRSAVTDEHARILDAIRRGRLNAIRREIETHMSIAASRLASAAPSLPVGDHSP